MSSDPATRRSGMSRLEMTERDGEEREREKNGVGETEAKFITAAAETARAETKRCEFIFSVVVVRSSS